jgi:hypothetical protein
MRKLFTKGRTLFAMALIVVTAVVMFSMRGRRVPTIQYFTATAQNGPLRNAVNAT